MSRHEKIMTEKDEEKKKNINQNDKTFKLEEILMC